METHSKIRGWFFAHLLHICMIQTFAQQFNHEHFLKPHCHELVLKEDLNRPHPMPSVPRPEEAFMRRRKNAKPATSPSPVPVNVDETEERQGIHWQDAVIQESSIRVFLRCFLLRYSNPVFWPLLNRNTTVFVFFSWLTGDSSAHNISKSWSVGARTSKNVWNGFGKSKIWGRRLPVGKGNEA